MSFDDHRQSGKEFLADRSKSTVHWHLVPPCRPDNPFVADPAPAEDIYVAYEQHLQRWSHRFGSTIESIATISFFHPMLVNLAPGNSDFSVPC
jgi:hypothetical protein